MKRLVMRVLGALLVLASTASAELVRFEVLSKRPLLDGRSFGAVGAYEMVRGIAHYAVDPKNPRNALIVDIERAPRNAAGLVEFSGDLVIIRPVQPERGNGITLIDVVNRGGITVLGMFNRGTGVGDLATAQQFGDGLLLERGFTLAIVGWEFDAPGVVRLSVPSAAGIEGIVRATVTPTSTRRGLVFADMRGYHPSDTASRLNTLTVRDAPESKARLVPRDAWSFVADTVVLRANATPGAIYELTIAAKDPPIAGLGFAAIRDAARWAKEHELASRRVIAFGNSQSGRFLRDFLYEGFNTDEREQRALDGVFAHVAGAARIDLNHRWSTPMGVAFLGATSYPFADAALRDPISGAQEGTLQNPRMPAASQPKIFYTNTGVEYWGGARVAALVHTTPDGARDIGLPPNVRIYFLAGSQHGPGAFPPGIGAGRVPANPTDYRTVMRALIVALEAWVRDDTEPPASKYPRLADNSLVSADRLDYPRIADLGLPPRGSAGWRLPNPLIAGNAAPGTPLPYLVPNVDHDGNEIAGVRLPDVTVPVATLTGWTYRRASIGAPDQLLPLVGSYVPLPVTAHDRAVRKDPRAAITERYASESLYVAQVRRAADALARDHYMLERDLDFVVNRAQAQWRLVNAHAPVEVGTLRLYPRVGMSAQVFHIVDQLAAWDARTHASYLRWAADSLVLNVTDSAYLKRHAALRRARGWNGGYEALFYSTSDLGLLETRSASGIPAAALRDESEVMKYFEQRLTPMLSRSMARVDSFATRLPRIHDSLESVLAPLQRLTGVAAPKDVEVYLVANPLAGSRGGRYVANRVVVEVPERPDPLASLYHELFHVLVRAHEPRIRAIAADVGLSFDELNEALAYAFPPGLGPDGADVLARQLNASALGSANRKTYAAATAIQPLLIEALAGHGTFAEFLTHVEKTLRTSRPI